MIQASVLSTCQVHTDIPPADAINQGTQKGTVILTTTHMGATITDYIGDDCMSLPLAVCCGSV